MKNNKPHYVIIFPGLGDKVLFVKIITLWWKFIGLQPIVCKVGWGFKNSNFKTQKDKMINIVDRFLQKGDVSIVGTSAGGSMAFNVFLERPDVIKNAVNICGRLRAGNHKFRSLEIMSKRSKIFKDSVLSFESKEKLIPQDIKDRMMTISARFGDELVPADTSLLLGGYNISVFMIEHGLSIRLSLTLFSKSMIDFIKMD